MIGVVMQSLETHFSNSPPPEIYKDTGLSFGEAAELSHGQYDTAEQRAERYLAALRLAETMQPGEPVIHQVNRLKVRGGILMAPPKVTVVGDSQELAIAYTLQNGQADTIRFRNLIYGTRYGAEQHLPVLVAGLDDIAGYIAGHYAKQRAMQQQGGAPWDDISHITELRAYAALSHAGLHATDIYPDEMVKALHQEWLEQAQDPQKKHLWPLLDEALLASGFF